MKVRIVKDGVTYESSVLPVGSELDLPESQAERLMSDGYVEVVPEPEKEPEKEPTKRGAKKSE